MGNEKMITSEAGCPDEEEVKTIVSTVVGEKVIEVTPIRKGEINYPFKIETEKGNLFLRVFARATWPEPDKPSWVASQLEENGFLTQGRYSMTGQIKYSPVVWK